MTYEGDLIIDGNRSVVIENCSFDIKGRIILSDSSTLVIRDAKVRLIESREEGIEESEFWFNISGNSRFQAVNIAIETIYFRSFSIHVSDGAEVLFDDVYSLEWYGLACEGDSRVQIVDSVCWSMIETRDKCVLSVSDSRIYGINVTDDSTAFLKGVYTTKASVAESGSLEIHNSTISSETDGLELVFDRGTSLTLNNFPTTSSGIEYEFCEYWSLCRDNEITNAHLNVTLNRVYLRLVRFVIPDGSDVGVNRLRNIHANIVCSNDGLEVVGSALNEVLILEDCYLNATSVEIAKLGASQHSSAHVHAATLGLVSCKNESLLQISSSVIDTVEAQGGAILQLSNCSLPELTSILENSIALHSLQPFSINEVDYSVAEGVLNLSITSHMEEATQLDMILNRDRIRNKKNLKISLDDEAQAFDVHDEKDLKTVSFQIPPGASRLSVFMGPPPPKRIPFFLTQVGQQLISFLIILALIVAVLLAWR